VASPPDSCSPFFFKF